MEGKTWSDSKTIKLHYEQYRERNLMAMVCDRNTEPDVICRRQA